MIELTVFDVAVNKRPGNTAHEQGWCTARRMEHNMKHYVINCEIILYHVVRLAQLSMETMIVYVVPVNVFCEMWIDNNMNLN